MIGRPDLQLSSDLWFNPTELQVISPIALPYKLDNHPEWQGKGLYEYIEVNPTRENSKALVGLPIEDEKVLNKV